MLFDVHYADRQRGLIDDTQEVPDASGCVMAASTTFKVVLAGGWKTFANEFLGAGSSNNQLFRNVINWLCR
jgi:hypothetical protein